MKPAPGLRWLAWWRPRITDPNAVLLRQLCIALVFALSLTVLAIPGMAATSPALVALSAAMVLAATATACVIDPTRRRHSVLLAIPFTDLVAVALLRSTTGGPSSVFGALLILAVLSLGIERGVWPIVLTAAGCLLAVGLPLVVAGQGMVPQQWVRVVFTPTVLILTVLSITVLMNRLRSRIGVVQRLSRAQERWLDSSRRLTLEAERQAALVRDGRDQLASVINAITEQLIVATDGVGRIEIFNPGAERMLSVRAEDMIGQDITAAFAPLVDFDAGPYRHPDGLGTDRELSGEEAFERIAESTLLGNSDGGEWTFRRRDGSVGVLEVTVTRRHDMTGQNDGYLFVGTDVSQARQIARQKDEFVNLISHELRTPLSSILGYLELMVDDEHPLSDEQHQYLGTVERNAHRLLRLVGDLLFTAQVEAGSFNLARQDVELTPLLTAAVDTALPAATARGVQLQVQPSGGRVFVSGDPVRLGQAFDNLLSNAVKFTPDGGRVTVALATAGGRATISFRDTGIGIPAGELDRLFTKFFRASTATQHAVAGVGLGLTITRAIAQAHGGSITVDSVEGAGTTFTVAVPLLEVRALDPDPASAPGPTAVLSRR